MSSGLTRNIDRSTHGGRQKYKPRLMEGCRFLINAGDPFRSGLATLGSFVAIVGDPLDHIENRILQRRHFSSEGFKRPHKHRDPTRVMDSGIPFASGPCVVFGALLQCVVGLHSSRDPKSM